MIKKILLCQILGWSFFVLSIISSAIIFSDFFFAGFVFLDRPPFLYITVFLLIFSFFSFVLSHVLKNEFDAGREKIDLVAIITKYSGQLTPSDFSLETGLSVEDAREKLDFMHRSGICTIFLTSSGIPIYSFSEFEGLTQVING